MRQIIKYSLLFVILLCTVTSSFDAFADENNGKVRISSQNPQIGEPVSVDIKADNIGSIVWSVNDTDVAENAETYTPTLDDLEKWISVSAYDEDNELIGSDKIYFSKLPVMYINIDDGTDLTEKGVTKEASLYFQGNKDFPAQYDGDITIKVRGNTSATNQQTPYKIKLAEKTNLLGMGSNKHWVLLSDSLDICGMRNKLGSEMSSRFGLENMSMTWVVLIMNGNYRGMYPLGEHIRIGKNRIDIFDWEEEAEDIAKQIYKKNKDTLTEEDRDNIDDMLCENLNWVTSRTFTYKDVEYRVDDYGCKETNTNGGYLFEMSREYDDVSRFHTAAGMPVMIDSPEYVKTNTTMFKYVKDYWNQYEKAIMSADGYNDNGEHYSELADFDSMVSYWLTMELMGNNDAYQKSRFAYKDIDKKMIFGPVWDFDWGCGSAAVGLTATGLKLSEGPLWRDFIDDPYFQVKAAEKYWENRDYLTYLVEDGGYFDTCYDYLKEAGNATIAAFPGWRGYDSDYSRFKTYMEERIEWFDTQFSNENLATSLLYLDKSTNPYIKSEDELSIQLINAVDDTENTNLPADGIISENNDLGFMVNISDADTKKIGVYVDGIKTGEYQVKESQLFIKINKESFIEETNTRNVVALIGYDEDGNITVTNYVSVICYASDEAKEYVAVYDSVPAAAGSKVNGKGILSASLNGSTPAQIVYSDAEYKDGEKVDVSVPVIKADDENAWGEGAHFQIELSTAGYKDISFSSSIGATKKGPAEYILEYSLDGNEFKAIPDSEVKLITNKTMLPLYSDFVLPEECWDSNNVYLRIKVASDTKVNGDEGLFSSTSGEAAIDHISIMGEKTDVSLADYKDAVLEAKELIDDRNEGTDNLKALIGQDITGATQDFINKLVDDIRKEIKAVIEAENTESTESTEENSEQDTNDDITTEETSSEEPANASTEQTSSKNELSTETATEDNIEADMIGTIIEKKGIVFKVIGDGTVSVEGVKKKKVKTIKIPATIKYNKMTFKVVSIRDGAFKGCRKLKKVTIPKYVNSIGKKAFYKCKSLKKVIIKTTKLKKKNIGAKAFKGISKKAEFKCPRKKRSSYRKWFKKAGAPSKSKYK